MVIFLFETLTSYYYATDECKEISLERVLGVKKLLTPSESKYLSFNQRNESMISIRDHFLESNRKSIYSKIIK